MNKTIAAVATFAALGAGALGVRADTIIISMNAMHHAACDPNEGNSADKACQGYTTGGLDHSRTLATGLTLHSWKDTLRLIYFGLAPSAFPLATGTGPGDQVLAANIARRNCEDPSRLELVNNFGKLFDIDCGSDGGCTKLQHAFRRDENQVTTDFFREILGVESGTQSLNKGFPFCNEYVPAVTINTTNNGNGTACSTNAQCTAPGYSLCGPSGSTGGTCHRPNNGCTVATSATDCPSGFSCDPGQLQCAQTCAIGNDATCSSVIPSATCHAAGVCKPGTCATDSDCQVTAGPKPKLVRGSCDTSSGTGLCRMPPSKVSCTVAGQCSGVGATCTLPTDMNATTGWCAALVDAPASDTKVEARCGLPGLVGGTQPGTVATVPGVFRSAVAGVGFENQQDNDPARRHVIGRNGLTGAGGGMLDANPAEQVATACGDLGVVLPISEPSDSPVPSDSINAFPNTVCGFGKFNFFPTVQIGIGANARWQLCPNGDMPLGATGWDPVIRGAKGGAGVCLTPVKSADAASANCLNGGTNRPGAGFSVPPSTYVTLHAGDPTSGVNVATIDARVYNLQVWQPATAALLQQPYYFNGQEQPPTPTPPETGTAINQNVVGAFYRIHSTRTAKGYTNATTVCNANADCPAATPTCDTGLHACFTNSEAGCNNVGADGTHNVCCETGQDTSQIGCLAIASPCSMGNANSASASCVNPVVQLTTQPTAGGAQVVETNFPVGLDTAVGGVVKEVSACSPNECIPASVLTTTPPTLQYPFSVDSAGDCAPGSTVSCGNYACSASSCASICSSPSDCSSAAYCDSASSACVSRIAPYGVCANNTQCISNVCAQGLCCDPTSTVDPLSSSPISSSVPTDFVTQVAPLYSGASATQLVAAGQLNPVQVAVIRGTVLDEFGAPVPCATISVVGQPGVGTTPTRADGVFAIAVNGGAPVTIRVQVAGYLSSDRQVDTKWHTYAQAQNVVLLQLPAASSANLVSSSSTDTTIISGAAETDAGSSHTARLLVAPGTTATVAGTSTILSSFNVLVKETTNLSKYGRDGMPATLPPTSAFTYAVTLSVAGYENQKITLSNPAAFYVENFVGITHNGEYVPVGYYDTDKAQWVASEIDDGKLFTIFSKKASGEAQLDLDGTPGAESDAAADAAGINFTERMKLGALYSAGQSLIRFSTNHFTTFDANWAYGLPDVNPPHNPPPKLPPCGCCGSGAPPAVGSIIDCEKRGLREEVPVAGTPFNLFYSSRNQQGGIAPLHIPVADNTLPSGVDHISPPNPSRRKNL